MNRAIFLFALSFTISYCGPTGFRSIGASNDSPSKSDFRVIGPDGSETTSIEESMMSAAKNEKLYFNNSGNPVGAPKWQSKTVSWYYNPQNQPSEFSVDDVVNKIQASMETWQSVCGIRWAYKGTSSAPATTHGNAIVTFGWGDVGRAAGITYLVWNYVGGFTDGDVVLSPSYVRDPMTLEGVLNHEIGHQLGLNHSDVSESIMFANPYHSVDYLLTLRQDDIEGCTGLYGTAPSSAPASTSPPPTETQPPTQPPVVQLPPRTTTPSTPTLPTGTTTLTRPRWSPLGSLRLPTR